MAILRSQVQYYVRCEARCVFMSKALHSITFLFLCSLHTYASVLPSIKFFIKIIIKLSGLQFFFVFYRNFPSWKLIETLLSSSQPLHACVIYLFCVSSKRILIMSVSAVVESWAQHKSSNANKNKRHPNTNLIWSEQYKPNRSSLNSTAVARL